MATDDAALTLVELTDLERRRRGHAARLGCFTEAEVVELTGYTPGTLYTYRRRRIGLPWVRIGPEVLYPVDALREHLAGRLVHPTEAGDET